MRPAQMEEMTMTAKTILVPLDGSHLAEAALPYGRLLAAALGAQLELLAVAQAVDGDRATGSESLAEYLAAVAEQVCGTQSVTRRVAVGDAAEEIVRAAQAADIAAMVLATHGRGGVRRAIIGSVADKVMRQTPVPLLIVRPPETFDPSAPAVLHRLMAPLDGSTRAEAALPWVSTLATATGAAVLLVRAEPPMIERVPSLEYVPDFTDLDTAIVAKAQTYLDEARGRLPATLHVETRVVPQAGLQLPRYAQDADIDLVVMTSRGQGGMQRLLLGSVADRMVRLGPPVMLVPAEEADNEGA